MKRETAAEWFETHMPAGKVKPVQKQAYLMALTALTLPTQEQMERVWPGCPHCMQTNARQRLGYQYCEHCGRPLTPEAWAEMRKRWEALYETE